jgi:hypothetical protein
MARASDRVGPRTSANAWLAAAGCFGMLMLKIPTRTSVVEWMGAS